MMRGLAFISWGIVLLACSTPAAFEGKTEQPAALTAGADPIRLTPAEKISVGEALNRIETSRARSGAPVSVVFEPIKDHDTAGRLSLHGTYPSLAALAKALTAQAPAYTWEVNQGVLLVFPTRGSVLNRALDPIELSELSPCAILVKLSEGLDQMSSPGCLVMRRSRVLSAAQTKALLDEPISLTIGPRARLADAVVSIIQKSGAPAGFSIFRLGGTSGLTWKIR